MCTVPLQVVYGPSAKNGVFKCIAADRIYDLKFADVPDDYPNESRYVAALEAVRSWTDIRPGYFGCHPLVSAEPAYGEECSICASKVIEF